MRSPRRLPATFALPAQDPAIIELERGLIGSCLIDSRGVRAWPTLMPHEFFLERHRVIWGAMLDMTERTDRPDLMGLTDALRRGGHLDEVGGPAALAEMVETGLHAVDLAYYGTRIRDASTARRKVAFAATLASNPNMPPAEIEAALRQLEAGSVVVSLGAAESLRAERERLRAEPALMTGLKALDRRTNGIMRGQVVVVGGRTSHGKTTFLAFLARQFALRGVHVAYLTLEERAEDLYAKWAAQATGVPTWKIQRDELTSDERKQVDQAADELDVLPLDVLAGRSHAEAEVVAAVAQSSASVVIVDHIQQVVTGDDNRAYGIERVMSRLAAIAVADRKLVMIAAQINRAIDGRREAPVLSDLRDSGGIEQVARLVMLVYWPVKHDPDRSPADYEVHVAKNTNGAIGRVDLTFDARCGRFRSPAVVALTSW